MSSPKGTEKAGARPAFTFGGDGGDGGAGAAKPVFSFGAAAGGSSSSSRAALSGAGPAGQPLFPGYGEGATAGECSASLLRLTRERDQVREIARVAIESAQSARAAEAKA